MDRLAQGKPSQCLVRMKRNTYKNLRCNDCITLFLLHVLGPSELDNFTDELRGVIPRSFEYLFFLINREVERVSCNLFTTVNAFQYQTPC